MADPVRSLGKTAVFRLDAAADLLRAPARGAGGWGLVIKVEAGEGWHQAVLRTIRALPGADQERLKGLVDWVQDYGADDEPPRPREAFVPAPHRPLAPPVPAAESTSTASYMDEEFFPSPDDDAVMQALASIEAVAERPRY